MYVIDMAVINIVTYDCHLVAVILKHLLRFSTLSKATKEALKITIPYDFRMNLKI